MATRYTLCFHTRRMHSRNAFREFPEDTSQFSHKDSRSLQRRFDRYGPRKEKCVRKVRSTIYSSCLHSLRVSHDFGITMHRRCNARTVTRVVVVHRLVDRKFGLEETGRSGPTRERERVPKTFPRFLIQKWARRQGRKFHASLEVFP